MSDDEDNNESGHDKKQPYQQYENLEDNTFSYAGFNAVIVDDAPLVDPAGSRFNTLPSDDSSRNRIQDWVSSTYLHPSKKRF